MTQSGMTPRMRERTLRTLAAVGADDLARRAWRRVPRGNVSQMRFPPYDETVKRLVKAAPDPVRFSTIAMALMRLEREHIEGDLAEVGVYRGELSRLIATVRPDRKLYLFDTFAGFPKQDLEVASDSRFRDTSMQSVRRRLPEGANVIFRKGYFPETAKGLEDNRFAFVMLDLDLFKPTVAGLEFFYERTNPGGFIFLDDYNNAESGWAVSRALNGFLEGKPERLVEIADAWGTVVMRKT
jgi:O-methyltransferase